MEGSERGLKESPKRSGNFLLINCSVLKERMERIFSLLSTELINLVSVN